VAGVTSATDVAAAAAGEEKVEQATVTSTPRDCGFFEKLFRCDDK